jgi:hypothetical protein
MSRDVAPSTKGGKDFAGFDFEVSNGMQLSHGQGTDA